MNRPANSPLDRFFGLTAHGTGVRTEIMAGITTFLTMCYIVVINPATLSQTGMDFGAVFVATCISAAIGCFVMGLAANYPIALAPGMGLNAYFTYAVVKGMGVPWQVALAAVFVSGIVFLLFSFFKLREMLVNALPMSLKMAIAAGIGLFLALIALKNAGIIISSDATLVKMNDIYLKAADGAKSPNWPVLLALLGFFLIIFLDYLRVRGAIILGILAVTLLGIPLGQTEFKGIVSAIPSLQPTFLAMDFNGLFHGSMIAVIFVFFLVDLFDSTGTLVGTTHRAGLLENGKLPRLKRALLADSTAIVAGAAMGTGFALVLIALGAMREILANGTLLAGADRIFGHGINWTIQLYHSDNHIILAALPPGAFLCYGLLIAAKNLINARLQKRRTAPAASADPVQS